MTSPRIALIRRTLLAGSILVSLLLASGCSSSSGNTTPAQFAFTSPSAGPVIDQGQSVTLTVNGPANWTMRAAFGTPQGYFIGKLNAAAGSTTATFNACTNTNYVTCYPGQQVSIIATSTADSSQTAAMTVTVPALPSIATSSPISIGCSSIPPGTVVLSFGASPYPFGWNVGGNRFYDLTATGGVPPYTWSVTSGTLPTGLSLSQDFSTELMSINGAPTSSTCQDFTLQVTDSANISTTIAYTILVLPTALSVQFPPVSTAYSGAVYPPTALMASGGVPPYTWIPDPSFAAFFPPGLNFSSPATNTNLGLVTGTPTPDGLFSNYSPAAYVYDSQSPYPAVAHPNINMGEGEVLPTTPACSDEGGSTTSLSTAAPYAFMLRGFDAHGPVVIAGNFTVDGNGNVLSGAEDINRTAGVQSNLSLTTASSYTVGLDNRGCMILKNSAGKTLTFETAWGTCSTSANLGTTPGCTNNGYFTRGRILIDDKATGIRASGIIRLQDPTTFTSAALSGTYAFGFSGFDAAGGRYAVAGSTSASSGSFSSLAADANDAGTLASNITGGTGTYGVDVSGRGTASITAGAATLGFVMYPVSASEAIFATSDPLDATHPTLSGEALAAPGTVGAPSLMNSYILRSSGVSSSAPNVGLGILTMDGISAVTGTLWQNSGGTLSTTSVNGVYEIDATTRRFAFSAPVQGENIGPHPLVGYVVNPASGVSAFIISTDASAQSGEMEFQIINPPLSTFNNASIVGAHFLGTDELMDAKTNTASGTLVATGNGNLAGQGLNLDASYVAGSVPGPSGLQPNSVFNANYSIGKTGTGTFTGQYLSVTNGVDLYYLDESPLNLHPAVTVVEP